MIGALVDSIDGPETSLSEATYGAQPLDILGMVMRLHLRIEFSVDEEQR